MQTYGDLVELARICLKQDREAKNAFVSAELRHIAKGYQVRAATMDHGRLPVLEKNRPSRRAFTFGRNQQIAWVRQRQK